MTWHFIAAQSPELANPRPKPIRNKAFLEFVRSKGCAIRRKNKHVCVLPIDAAHVEGRGTGTKADDILTIPLCRLAHGVQHSIGWDKFEFRYGIDRYAINADLRTEWNRRTAQ